MSGLPRVIDSVVVCRQLWITDSETSSCWVRPEPDNGQRCTTRNVPSSKARTSKPPAAMARKPEYSCRGSNAPGRGSVASRSMKRTARRPGQSLHTAFLASVSVGGNMDLGLKGKRVLVTGGTKSIGRAIVDAFVAEGAVVGFCARDAKLVKQREDGMAIQAGARRRHRARRHRRSALKKWIDGFAGRRRHRPFRRQCQRARHRGYAGRLAQGDRRSTSSRR